MTRLVLVYRRIRFDIGVFVFVVAISCGSSCFLTTTAGAIKPQLIPIKTDSNRKMFVGLVWSAQCTHPLSIKFSVTSSQLAHGFMSSNIKYCTGASTSRHPSWHSGNLQHQSAAWTSLIKFATATKALTEYCCWPQCIRRAHLLIAKLVLLKRAITFL